MIPGREIELSWHSPAPYLDICRLIAALGNAGVQNIRQSHLQLGHLRLDLLQPPLDTLQLSAQRFARRQQAAGVQALRFGLPYGFGVGVALGA